MRYISQALLGAGVAVLLTATGARAQFTWDFSSTAPSGSISNLTSSDLSRGNNNPDPGTNLLITNTSVSSGYAGASGGNNAGVAARTGALNTGSGGSAYFEFTLTPATGFSVRLNSIQFGARSTGTGPQAISLRTTQNLASQLLGFTAANDSAWSLKSGSGPFDFTANTPVTFRLYGFNGTGTPGTNTTNWRIDDLLVNASAISAGGAVNGPEPATVALFAVGGVLGMVAARRRK